MDDLRRIWLRRDRIMNRSHLLRANCGLRASVFREGLCLDGRVGPSNLRVHLEIDHRCRYRWWGRAAILRGQECERRSEVWAKVIGSNIGPLWGGGLRLNSCFDEDDYLCVCRTRVKFFRKTLPRSRGYQALSRYVRYTSILGHYQEMVVVRGRGGCKRMARTAASFRRLR